MFAISLGEYTVYDRYKNRGQHVQEKIDSLIVAGKLMGYIIDIKKIDYKDGVIRIMFIKKGQDNFSLYFYLEEKSNTVDTITLNYTNSNQLRRHLNYNFKSTNQKSIRKIFNKMENIL